MKIKVTLSEILHASIDAWDDYCEKYGLSPWALNEGLAQGSEEVEISVEDARKYGLLRRDD